MRSGRTPTLWVGKQIVVSPSMTPFKGKMVETIRVEPLLTPAVPAVNGSGEPHYTPEEIARMEAAVLKHQAAKKETAAYLSAAERRNPEVLVMMRPMSRRAVSRRDIHHRIGNDTVSLYPYAIGYARARLADLSMSTARQGARL